jgi:hypothetical protein
MAVRLHHVLCYLAKRIGLGATSLGELIGAKGWQILVILKPWKILDSY